MSSYRRWFWRAGLGVLAAVLVEGATPRPVAAAWPMKQEAGHLVVDTPHYQIKTDYAPDTAQMIASQQEALYQEVVRRVGGSKPAVQVRRMQIIVFTSEKKLKDATAHEAPGASALFMRENISGWSPPEALDNLLEMLRREGTRQLMMQFIGPKCPVWISAGLPTYFSYAQFKDGKLTLGLAPVAVVSTVKRGLASDKLLPLARMMDMTVDEWNAASKVKSQAGLYQIEQAWAMVQFLENGDGGKYRVPFAQFMSGIPVAVSAKDAWTHLFGDNLAAFEKRWRDYLKDLKATTGLGCRNNLQSLAFLLASLKPGVEPPADMAEFREWGLTGKLGNLDFTTASGTKISTADPEIMKSIFRCPEDKTTGDACSYELMPPNKPGEPPVVRCRHHQGFVLETMYEKDAKTGAWNVGVVSRPPKPGEKTGAAVERKPPAGSSKTPAATEASKP